MVQEEYIGEGFCMKIHDNAAWPIGIEGRLPFWIGSGNHGKGLRASTELFAITVYKF